MSVNSAAKDERKGCMKSTDVINDWDDTGSSATFPVLPTVCPIKIPREDTITYPVTEVKPKQAKDAFCLQVAGTVGTPDSCYSYDHYGMLDRTVSLASAVQTELPNSLQQLVL